MSSQFDGWTQLLALAQQHKTKADLRKAIVASGLRLIEDDPLSGYYRLKGAPVAIWRDGNKLCVMLRDNEVPLDRVWPSCVWEPVPYEWFEQAMDGKPWPDDLPPPDHNTAGLDEFESLKEQIDNAVSLTDIEISNDDEAAAAQSMRARLNELSGNADKLRVAEKAPHLDASRKVDAKWQPLVKKAKEGADTLRRAIAVYETAKLRADEARRAAAAVPQPPNPPAVAARHTIKGAYGKAATVTPVPSGKVVDYDAAYAALKEDPEIKQAIDNAAHRAVKAGHTVPGVVVEMVAAVA